MFEINKFFILCYQIKQCGPPKLFIFFPYNPTIYGTIIFLMSLNVYLFTSIIKHGTTLNNFFEYTSYYATFKQLTFFLMFAYHLVHMMRSWCEHMDN